MMIRNGQVQTMYVEQDRFENEMKERVLVVFNQKYGYIKG